MEKQKNKKVMPIIIIFIIVALIAGAVVLFLKRAPTTIAEAKEMEYHTNENISLVDDYGNTIILPAGFKIALDSENVVTKGVVIEDVSETATNGSQFVWIPVTKQDGTKIKTSESDTEGLDNPLNRYLWKDNATISEELGSLPFKIEQGAFIEESKTTEYGNAIAKDIDDFCNKAKISGGFYIGRYEASKSVETIATKKNQEPYVNVTQNDASALCQEMYKQTTFSSDLINSYAWDTTIMFIKKCGGYNEYPGANLSTKYGMTGENRDEILKINDMSGNAQEWSTESFTYTEVDIGTARGGYFYEDDINSFSDNDAAYRSGIEISSGEGVTSFRPILYM